MALSRDTRNEKILKAVRRAEFALKQRIERINWEEDELIPEILDFQGRAQLPQPPSETIIDLKYANPTAPKKKPRASRNGN